MRSKTNTSARTRYNKNKPAVGTLKVWHVDPFGDIDQPVTFIQQPDGAVVRVLGSTAKAKEMLEEVSIETGFRVIATYGIEGIASTDPHWNGCPTLWCENCKTLHDIDENVAQNLYKAMGCSL